MVRAVAFVPGSPLLVPGLGGAADVLADLRAVCLDAVGVLGPGPAVVLAAASHPGTYPAADVGSWLASAAGLTVAAVVTPADVDSDAVPDDAALLVVADGSARRGPQAPLPADDRAEPWDDDLAAALAAGHLDDGDPGAHDRDVDWELGAELGASADVWRVAARLAAGRSWRATALAHEAPLGVAYLVATWL